MAAAAQGQDATPKRFHPILAYAKEIVERRGADVPTLSEWEDIVKMLEDRCAPSDLPPQAALNSAKVLLEMEFAKPKSVEITGLSQCAPTVKPLTDDEIELFNKHFDADY